VARFRPFRGIRFSAGKSTARPSRRAAYDVISPDKRDELYRGSAPQRHTADPQSRRSRPKQRASFAAWVDDGTLERDDSPSFYVYRQDFACDGAKSRVGVIGAMHLEPFSTGVVRPHERTFAHHKQDRLELTRQVKANLSAIFGLYSNASSTRRRTADGKRRPTWTSCTRTCATGCGASPPRPCRRDRSRGGGTNRVHRRRAPPLRDRAQLLRRAASGSPAGPTGGPDDDDEPAAHVMTFLARFEDRE
jgi:hypothetical protein